MIAPRPPLRLGFRGRSESNLGKIWSDAQRSRSWPITRALSDRCDWLQSLERVDALAAWGIPGQRDGRHLEQQRGAVGMRIHDSARTDQPTGPRGVLDDDRLIPDNPELSGHRTCDRVSVPPPRGVRHHDRHRLVGAPRRGLCRGGERYHQRRRDDTSHSSTCPFELDLVCITALSFIGSFRAIWPHSPNSGSLTTGTGLRRMRFSPA